MVRHWIIRGIFLFFLALFVAGWGVSTCRDMGCEYFHGRHLVACSVRHGELLFSWLRGRPTLNACYGRCDPEPFRLLDARFLWYFDSAARPGHTFFGVTVVGFRYVQVSNIPASGTPDDGHVIGIPFWFLIVVIGGGGWWAWRRTRPPLQQRRGFPVEMGERQKTEDGRP